MALRMAFRSGLAARPLPSTQSSSRPALSWAARWKGSTASADKEDSSKADETKPEVAVAEKPKPAAAPTADLPVTFEVRRRGIVAHSGVGADAGIYHRKY